MPFFLQSPKVLALFPKLGIEFWGIKLGAWAVTSLAFLKMYAQTRNANNT
jgi:hypothetical protein